MRKKMKSDERVPFDELFFVGDFGHPLAEANAGALAAPLRMATLRDSIVTVTVKSELWIFRICSIAILELHASDARD